MFRVSTNRPLPDSVCFSLTKFNQIWIVDGSTLEALFRKLDSLKDIPTGKLAGKMAVVMDLATRLPVEIWIEENPNISDVKFEKNIINLVKSKTLLLLDRGLYHFIVAYNKGKAKDIIKYFAAPENRDLGIIKRRRKPRQKLIIAPFPEVGKNRKNFFFENPLTPCF